MRARRSRPIDANCETHAQLIISDDAMPTELHDHLGRTRRYVAYYRMSTGRLDQFAFGFDAQRADVLRYVSANSGQLVAEFSETVSGRKVDRPELGQALYLCRLFHAVLVVAHLDRLARNVHMISRLMEAGVEFVAVDFPQADKFTLHVLAAIAEYESQLISDRVKAAYASARNRGVSLGPRIKNPNPKLGPGAAEISARNRRARKEARAHDLGPLIWKARAAGKSNRMIAEEFNQTGVRRRGAVPWNSESIWTVASQSYQEFGAPLGLPPPTNQRETMSAIIRDIGPRLVAWRRQGMSFATMASELNALGCPTPRGGIWWAKTVRPYFRRIPPHSLPGRAPKETA